MSREATKKWSRYAKPTRDMIVSRKTVKEGFYEQRGFLKRSGDGILYNDHKAGGIGPRLFEQACRMGIEGMGSKHRDRTI
jgi:hypothetical protein